ncbi:hypothetical protein ACSBR1_037342 [Camellia fascicularis]
MYRKVFKAEFEFPPWISSEARRLILKLLMADPDRRITIPGIMRVPWFNKGFTRAHSFSIRQDLIEKSEEFEEQELTQMKKSASSPTFFNAFEFISSMSSGFDLSSLFENKRRVGSMFTSRCSASAIMEKIEAAGKGLS